MNFKIFKACSFWTRFAIFEFATVLAIISIPSTILGSTTKVLFLVLSFPLYFFSETGIGQLLKLKVKHEIQTKLSQVDVLNNLEPSQNLRANIFLLNKKGGKYFIVESYNMNTDCDRTIEIPENMGCTGEAWRTKTQIWGEKDRIFKDGNHRLPEGPLKKVRKDLEWICSTPIVNNQKVIAVLNFDGNKKMTESQQ
jgi:hypothetical protein